VARSKSPAKRPRLLITTTHYWPEVAGNAPYIDGLARYMADAGWIVDVATGFAHYPGWRFETKPALARAEWREGVRIRRRLHYVPRRQNAATRALYELSQLVGGTTALGIRSRPDAILGVSPDLAGVVLARLASRVHRRPYGVLFQDVMGLAAEQSGLSGGSVAARLLRPIEVSVARKAQLVGIVAPGFRSYFEEGGCGDRIVELRNWVLGVPPTGDRTGIRRQYGWEDTDLVCLHAGNMGRKQGLVNVVRASAHVASGVRVVFAGDGNERDALAAENARLGNPVQFLPSQAPGRYEALLRAADALLVNQRAEVGDMSLASKLTSYFAAGRPIVGAVNESSATGRELVTSGAARVVPPNDPQRLAQALNELQLDATARETLGRAGEARAAQLSEAVLLPEYARFITRIAEGGE
jgi:colanic acid biosynthesis glycosyl transferase WcaI